MASVSGWDSFQVGGLVQSGRQALLKKNFAQALGYFEPAAKKDPNYVYRSAHFSEGIWTYVGRSQYATGHFQAARQSLEISLNTRPDDPSARLERNPKRLAGTLRLDRNIVVSRPFEAYWDPNKQLRNELKKTLAMIAEANADGAKIVAGAEWLGQEIEEESERARRAGSRQD